MVKALSEQLSDLSVRAKGAEDAVAAAKKEALEKIAARRERSHAAATAAVEKVKQDIQSVGGSASRNWEALQSKLAADWEALNANIRQRQQDRDVKLTEQRAEKREQEAGWAIDYAVASIEQAKFAVLDAMIGRAEAEVAKRA
jgi:hypothetical protein